MYAKDTYFSTRLNRIFLNCKTRIKLYFIVTFFCDAIIFNIPVFYSDYTLGWDRIIPCYRLFSDFLKKPAILPTQSIEKFWNLQVNMFFFACNLKAIFKQCLFRSTSICPCNIGFIKSVKLAGFMHANVHANIHDLV